ncbi:MAG: hypothetical protein D6689_02590 [Deltaproteobacteria bacterium]|nr:MAG: hypothetical protein D6689_02590 [Deltaproteobacteria bacterium]
MRGDRGDRVAAGRAQPCAVARVRGWRAGGRARRAACDPDVRGCTAGPLGWPRRRGVDRAAGPRLYSP